MGLKGHGLPFQFLEAYLALPNLQVAGAAAHDGEEIDDTDAARLFEMRRGCPRAVRIVVVMSEPAITFGTEQAAHLVCRMAMINAQLVEFLFADRTDALLLREHCVVSVVGKPVDTKASFFTISGISASPELGDFAPMRRAVLAGVFYPLSSIFWIRCISLPVAFAA